jgi:methylenetetrahydrofolate reductase (NADPH)
MTNRASASSSVAEMLRGYSIELNPRDSKAVESAQSRLTPGTEVFLTWIPGSDPMDLVAAAANLRRAGLIPFPHIGARHVESTSQLSRLITRLSSEAGVDRVLIIGGDRHKPAGPFDSSLAVMQSGLLQQAGITEIAVAGFPQGNPHIPEATLAEALAAKVCYARSAGLQISIVTQFCFEAAAIVAWVGHVRTMGIDIPVRIGLAGPSGLLTLTRYALRCGVGTSLRVVTENPSFAKLLVEKGPEPVVQDLAVATGAGRGKSPLGITGLHFFVFGGFNKTVDWIESYPLPSSYAARTRELRAAG